MRKAFRQFRNKNYNLMIVPPDAHHPSISIKIPQWLVLGFLASLMISLVVVGGSFIYSSFLTRKLISYSALRAENLEQKRTISLFEDKTRLLRSKIENLLKRDEEVRKLLGLTLDGDVTKPLTNPKNTSLTSLEKSLEKQSARAKKLIAKVKAIRERYARTPSIWPVSGNIGSYFGYRTYPWSGFHSGIDINNDYNSPIKAAAAGVISYVGWHQGYGKTVIINHGDNVETLYGHMSSYRAALGNRIRKGEVIGYIGLTGYTTGPHVHYEVRKFGLAVNPVSYLDLDIFTASKIWGIQEGKL